MKKILSLVVVLLAMPMVSATPLEYYETVINLDSENAQFTFIFLFEEAPDGMLEYALPFSIEDFNTSANFGNYTCTSSGEQWGTLIKCDFSEVTSGGRALNIKFNTTETTREMEKRVHFNANIKTPQEVEKMVLKAVLQKGYVLIEEPQGPTTMVPYSPSDGVQGSDGRRIFVEWSRENVKKGEGIDVSLTYERIAPQVSGNQNMIFLFIGILILLIIFLLLGLRNRSAKEMDMSILKDDEKRVMEILKERGGMCKQRVIVRETDFSKAKVSRLIKDLEERKLIRTEKEGRTNRIYVNP